MPVTTAGLADVGSGNPHPAELSRPGKHLIEQLAIAGLPVRTRAQRLACVPDADCKRIARRLQLAKAKCPRCARDGGDTRV